MTGSRRSWRATEDRAKILAREASLRGSGGWEIDQTWLGAAVRWLSETSPTWEEMAGSAPEERSYRLLHSSLNIEAWLICWPPGGRLQLHDHGGASGAFHVLSGVLEERWLRAHFEPDGRIEGHAPPRSRTVVAGRQIDFDASHVHDVTSTGALPATSIHVYGAANREMAFYQLDGELITTIEPRQSRTLVQAELDAEVQLEEAQPAPAR